MTEPPPVPPPPPPPPYGSPYTGPAFGAAQLRYASFGRRLAAELLDGLVLTAVYLVMYAVLALLFIALRPASINVATVVVVLLGLAVYIVLLAWFMLMEAGPYGQTVGKRLMKIRVVNRGGESISKASAVGRYFARIVSVMPMYIGFLFPLWDAERRALHDMIVDTRVVHADSTPPLRDVVTAPFRRRNAVAR